MKANTKVQKDNVEKTELELWKEKFKKVYKSYIGNKEYTWRRITRKEYAEVMSIKKGADADEKIYNRQCEIVRKVILGMSLKEINSDMEDLSGLAISLSDKIMEMSGFDILMTKEL